MYCLSNELLLSYFKFCLGSSLCEEFRQISWCFTPRDFLVFYNHRRTLRRCCKKGRCKYWEYVDAYTYSQYVDAVYRIGCGIGFSVCLDSWVYAWVKRYRRGLYTNSSFYVQCCRGWESYFIILLSCVRIYLYSHCLFVTVDRDKWPLSGTGCDGLAVCLTRGWTLLVFELSMLMDEFSWCLLLTILCDGLCACACSSISGVRVQVSPVCVWAYVLSLHWCSTCK